MIGMMVPICIAINTPGKINMAPENGPWRSIFLYDSVVFRIHVNLPGRILIKVGQALCRT